MSKSKQRVTLLIDGDILAFQVAVRSQKSFDFGDNEGFTEEGAEPTQPTEDNQPAVYLKGEADVLHDLAEAIDGYMQATDGDDFYICLSCPGKDNWRLKVLPSYKANRKDTVRPQLLEVAKDLLRKHYRVLEFPKLEADDVMGIFSTDPEFLPDNKKIVVSIDKDLRTIPGWLYNPNIGKVERITEEGADRYHMSQAITGDAVDGYPGCPGAGKVAAEEALSSPDFDSSWEAVLSVYYRKPYQEALASARISNILRHGQYDFKKKKVRLWEPPK
ncbi:MAG: hypothetical protein KGI54_08385 [Pseudomonadota bacterium]|nr:hypothetical protein [Pseudomonadota bacterium]